MKLGDKRMRFGRLPKDETISSKQLQIENRLLEERLAAIKKFTEEERKKTEARNATQASNSKGFAIRELKRLNLRPADKDQNELNKEIVSIQQSFAKKGIRAYEEVVKNRRIGKEPPVPTKEKPSEELAALLESLNMGKFLPDIQKQGVLTVDQLKKFEISKLGLLPGFEIKLSKRLAELKAASGDGRRTSTIKETSAQMSDGDEDFLTKKSVPTEKPKRYKAILSKHRSLHEDSTMSNLKEKTNESVTPRPSQDDFGCGPADAGEAKPKTSCWTCLTLIEADKRPATHPILEGKVVSSLTRCFALWSVYAKNSRL